MELKSRLQKSGFIDVTYMVVNMAESVKQIGLLESIVDFEVYQDTNGSIWKMLNGSKDDFYIYDFCGKLSEYIPKDRSYLRRDDVKNAILNTYNQDHKCGQCRERPKEKKRILQKEEKETEPCLNLPLFDALCPSWAKRGLCIKGSKHNRFMENYCRRTCNFCKEHKEGH